MNDVWNLFSSLSINKSLLEEFSCFGKENKEVEIEKLNWKSYFNNEYPYILLFSLKTVHSFITTSNNGSSPNKKRIKVINDEDSDNNSNDNINIEWLKNFVNNSGIVILFNLLHEKLHENIFNSNLFFQCLSEILKILIIIVSNNIINDYITQNLKLIVEKLLEISSFIFTNSYNNDTNPDLIKIQSEFSKKREKILKFRKSLLKNYNLDGGEELHEIIRNNYNMEISCIELILTLFSNLNNNNLVISTIMANKYLKDILTNGLILPNNNMIKDLFINFIIKSQASSSNSSSEKDKIDKNSIINQLASILFETNTFELVKKHSDNSKPYFNILVNVLKEVNFDTSEFNFEQLAESLIYYCSNFHSSDNQKEYQYLEGCIRIITILILNNNKIYDIAIKTDLYSVLTKKFILSKILSKNILKKLNN